MPVVLALLVIPVQAGADSGDIDRPNEPSLAEFAAFGQYEGELGPADPADWYRLVAPPGTRLRIEVETLNDARVGLVWLWEGFRLSYPVTEPGNPYHSGDVAREFRERELVVALESWDGLQAAYTVRFLAVPTADLAISNLTVEGVPPALAPVLDLQTERVIHVDVANLGLAEGAEDLKFVATTPDGHWSFLGSVPLSLAPGERQHVVFAWSALDHGILGDVMIRAYAWPEWDADLTNNEAETTTWTLAPGTGAGHTLAAAAGNCWYSVAVACAYVGAAPSWAVVGARVGVLGQSVGGYVIASKSNGLHFVEW